MRTLKTLLLVILLAASSAAAPKAKIAYQVAFVAAGHLIHHDELLSAKAALETAKEMNRLKEDEGAFHFVIAVEVSP